MENIQTKMKELFGSSCYGYCLAFLFGKSNEIHFLTRTFLEGWFNGYIDDSGYVSFPISYIKMICGKNFWEVRKPKINSLSQLPDDGLYIVEWKKTPDSEASHFVVCNRNGVIFDPSGDSITVQTGKPYSYRLFLEK